MRKTNWKILTSLSLLCSALLAGLAVWLALNPPQPAFVMPEYGDAESYARQAQLWARQGHFAEAAQLNQKALAFHPGSAILLYNQGWLAAQEGKWQQAMSYLSKAQLVRPQDPETLYLKAWVAQQLGDKTIQLQTLKQAPADWKPEGAIAQARLLQLKGQHADALLVFEKALQQASGLQKASLYFWRSESQLALHHLPEATKDLTNYLALQPNAQAYLQRGQVLLSQKQADKAIADFQQCLAAKPQPEIAVQCQKYLLYLSPQQSLPELQQKAQTHPQDPHWQSLYLQALLLNKQSKHVQEKLTLLLKKHPQQAEFWGLQAQLQRMNRKYPEAQQALDKAQQLGYPESDALLEQARLAAQQGQKIQVQQLLQQLIKLSPAHRADLMIDRLLKKWL